MELPARFGKYELEEFLGRGEADAYRARDTETGRMVVVKILTEAACADAAAKERFLEEAGIYDLGEDDSGRPFLVTESLPAPALRIVARKPATAAGTGSRLRGTVPAVVAAVLLLAAAAYFWLRPKVALAPGPAQAIVTPAGAMVLVPAGTFLFGETKEPIWMPAYYIDKTEVTNAAYAAFCRAAAHGLPPDFPPDKPGYPVVNVSTLDARAFAAWAGERLPNGREWEKAARGEKGQAFPWGDQLDRSRTNIGLALLLPADAFPKGASPYGALQMIGNAWEWVNDMRSPTQEEVEDFANRVKPPLASDELWYAVRGGAFDYPQLTPLLIWDSKPAPERWRSPDIGFRCVKDAR
jgi:formylglycine-generating enzyme required for sulfatase activity